MFRRMNSHLEILWNMWCCCIQRSQHFRCATLVWLSSTVCFQMSIQSASMRGNKIAANALVWPFTVCFSNVFSNRLPERRHICTICIFWLVSTMCFQMSVHNDCMRIKSGIGCIICSTFLQWLFSYVFSNSQPGRRRSHIGCTCLVFFYHMFSNVPSNGLRKRMQSHICCTFYSFLHWDSTCK